LKDNYLNNFQGKYQGFVKENVLPEKNGDKVLNKVFCCLGKIIKEAYFYNTLRGTLYLDQKPC
jgi:hypothetical protein